MRAREIHTTAEQLLGAPLLWTSVKGTLAAYASGCNPRFRRVRRGVYQLEMHTDTDEQGVTLRATLPLRVPRERVQRQVDQLLDEPSSTGTRGGDGPPTRSSPQRLRAGGPSPEAASLDVPRFAGRASA